MKDRIKSFFHLFFYGNPSLITMMAWFYVYKKIYYTIFPVFNLIFEIKNQMSNAKTRKKTLIANNIKMGL